MHQRDVALGIGIRRDRPSVAHRHSAGLVELDSGQVAEYSSGWPDRRGVDIREPNRVLDPERADRFPTEGSQVGAHSQPLAEITRQRPDIGAGAHGDTKHQRGRRILHQVDLPHDDRARWIESLVAS